ncbi:hypothetical protein BAE44_0003115 [Dichanthelium oligosanthes]|uniref:Uncharacterized protein n=1 Tax=Dichanthelium oligosanthes TaxID=888268 RepID=A0A1E5WEQ1_9POAL|nr:hypothetical protein BAE44_0003115 [Dichanthelium oligosanthes]
MHRSLAKAAAYIRARPC